PTCFGEHRGVSPTCSGRDERDQFPPEHNAIAYICAYAKAAAYFQFAALIIAAGAAPHLQLDLAFRRIAEARSVGPFPTRRICLLTAGSTAAHSCEVPLHRNQEKRYHVASPSSERGTGELQTNRIARFRRPGGLAAAAFARAPTEFSARSAWH